MARELNVKIVGDPKSFLNAADKVDKRSKRLGKSLGRTAKNVAKVGAAAVAGLTVASAVIIKKGVDAASDLEEVVSKSSVIFGEAADSVMDYASTAADSLGMTTVAALESATQIGAMLTPLGITGKAAADFSVDITNMASDLASFHNEDPTEMLNRLQAGLNGEAEPLRRFGINITAARTKMKALEMGLISEGDELDANSKLLANNAIIMEDAAQASGDFARTSEGLANSQRIMNAQLGDLSAKIGGVFLPIATRAVGFITSEMIPKMSEWASIASEKLSPIMAELGPRISEAFSGLMKVMAPAGDFLKEMAGAILPALKDQSERVFEAMKKTLAVLWKLAEPLLRALGNVIKKVIIPAVQGLREIFVSVMEKVGQVLAERGPKLERIFKGVSKVVNGLATVLGFLVTRVIIPVLKPVLTFVLPQAIGLVIDAIDLFVQGIEYLVENVPKWARSLSDWFVRKFNEIKNIVFSVKNAFVTTFDTIRGAIETAIAPIQKMIDLLGKIPDLLGKVGGFASKLNPFGQGMDANADAMRSIGGYSPALTPALMAGSSLGLTPTTYGGHHPSSDRAIDWFGPSDRLAALANWAKGQSGIEQLIYSPWGIWTAQRASEGVRAVSGTSVDGRPLLGTHNDHLHMGTFDQGGWLMPGTTIAQNNTGRPERISPPGGSGNITVNVTVQGSVATERDLAVSVRNEIVKLQRRNSTSGIV